MKLSGWFDVLREINLNKIQHEADVRFIALVVGEPELTGPFAATLGRTGDGAAGHPWVTAHALPLPEGMEVTLPAVAFVLANGPDFDEVRQSTLRRLKKAGVRTVAVVVGDRAALPESAFLARPGEDARTVVAPGADEAALRHAIVPALLTAEGDGPPLVLPMARRLPVLREAYIKALTEDVARTNGGFALSTGLVDLVPGFSLPLTAADVVVLTKNQIVMAYRIALAAGKAGDARTLVPEVLGVIGAGVLFRQVARELVGALPVIGLVPKIAVAYAGTHIVALAVRTWALEGRKMKVNELREMYDTSLKGGRAVAEELVAKARAARGVARRPDGEDDHPEG